MMFKIAFLTLSLLFTFITSTWAGRCGIPPSKAWGASLYNYQRDSYIVIEGTISGLPDSYYKATPDIAAPPPFPGLLSHCKVNLFVVPQTPSHPYYCIYYIFKDTAFRSDCAEFFRNYNPLRLEINSILLRKSENSPRIMLRTEKTVHNITLGPVHTLKLQQSEQVKQLNSGVQKTPITPLTPGINTKNRIKP